MRHQYEEIIKKYSKQLFRNMKMHTHYTLPTQTDVLVILSRLMKA